MSAFNGTLGTENRNIEQSIGGHFKGKYKVVSAASFELTKGQMDSLKKGDLVKRVELDMAGQYLLDTATCRSGVRPANTDSGVEGTGLTIGICDTNAELKRKGV